MTAETATAAEPAPPLARMIELWAYLAADYPADQLLDRLLEAASFSPDLRFPMLTRLPALFTHKRAEVRSAALRILSGMTGPLAWKQLLAGLDDPDTSVRETAVLALRASAVHDPPRLAHAIFHSDPFIRRTICALPWLAAAAPIYLHLLADPECCELVVDRALELSLIEDLTRHTAGLFATGQLNERALLAMLPARFRGLGYDGNLESAVGDLYATGELTPRLLLAVATSSFPALLLARECPAALACLKLDEVMFSTSAGPTRGDDEVKHMLQTVRSPRGLAALHKTPGPDALDDLLDQFWNAATDSTAPTWFAAHGIPCDRCKYLSQQEQLTLSFTEFSARFVAAVCYAAHRHQTWHAGAVILAAKLDPRMLVLPAIPSEIREAAINAVLEIPPDDPSFLHLSWVKTLLSKQAQQLSGPNLRLLAALARFLPEKKLETVVEAVTLPVLTTAALADPHSAIPLFLLADDQTLRRDWLKDLGNRKQARVIVAARLAFHLPPDEWSELVEQWRPSALMRTAIAIAKLEAEGQSATKVADVPLLGFRLAREITSESRVLKLFHSSWPAELPHNRPFASRLWHAIQAAPLESLPLTARGIPLTDVNAIGDANTSQIPPPATAGELSVCIDLVQLAGWCASDSESLAEDAAARLIELGDRGLRKLLEVIASEPAVPNCERLAWTITFCPEPAIHKFAIPFFRDERESPRARLFVGLALLEIGADVFNALVTLAAEHCHESWFKLAHWRRLREHDPVGLALHVVFAKRSVYANWSLRTLEDASAWNTHPGIFEQLARRSPERIEFSLAARLWQDKVKPRPEMFALLLHYLVSPTVKLPDAAEQMFTHANRIYIREFVTAALTAGKEILPDDRFLKLIVPIADRVARAEALRSIVLQCTDPTIRGHAAAMLQQIGYISPKFRRIVDVCVWGVRLSQTLFGRSYRIRLLGSDRLGYTQLNRAAIYVSVLPLLAGERNGKAIVEGLILHEFGHHLYHKTPEHLEVNKLADEEKLHSILNLVNDEHLERNLRAIDAGYGDRLKKLASYAFQHLEREFRVETLLARLGPHAFPILTHSRVKLARQPGHIKLESGHVLQELEPVGASFARFFRGLRMGLGNRHEDPRVDEGLALFGKSFRHSTAAEQLDISRKIREIFQDEADLLEAFEHGSDVPTEDILWQTMAEGINDDLLQSAVDAALKIRPPDPPKRRRNDDEDEPGLIPQGGINRSDEDKFELLKQITQSPHDPAAHARYADRVKNEARRLRDYLTDLGRKRQKERFRLAGSRFDASRAAALILKNDPRVMIARKMKRASDLFLGVLVDCSTSMSGERIENAKLFATLVSEAVRGLPGIDVRNFGFNHEKIIEAGDALRCGVHGLEADGGNNDAGALWHAAKAALRSKRQAKVLVMISDGSPTSCSVGALKNLVLDLTRRQRMICAQVAVAPLSDICFPYHVVLDPQHWQESAQRFGRIVAGLVGKAFG